MFTENAYPRRFDRPAPPIKMERLLAFREDKDGVKIFLGKSAEAYAAHLEAMFSPDARKAFETALQIAKRVKQAGGRALLVGGIVRDEVLGLPSNDIDMEIYGVDPARAEAIGVGKEAPKAMLRGNDLLALGYKPGPLFTTVIRLADQCRDAAGQSREDVLGLFAAHKNLEDVIVAMQGVLAERAEAA